jgi:hypothetical protein
MYTCLHLVLLISSPPPFVRGASALCIRRVGTRMHNVRRRTHFLSLFVRRRTRFYTTMCVVPPKMGRRGSVVESAQLEKAPPSSDSRVFTVTRKADSLLSTPVLIMLVIVTRQYRRRGDIINDRVSRVHRHHRHRHRHRHDRVSRLHRHRPSTFRL